MRIKVPVATAIVITWRSVFGRLGLVLELGSLPLLVILAALLVPALLLRLPPVAHLAAAIPQEVAIAGEILDGVIVLLALNAFAARWHRHMLLGPTGWPPGAFLRTWLRFIAYTLVIGLAGNALMAGIWYAGLADAGQSDAAAAMASAIAAAIMLGFSLAVARISLLFPAAAFGEPLAIAAAWRRMGGNSWRLFLANFAAMLPVILATEIILGQLLTAAHLGPADALSANPPLGLVLLSSLVEALLLLILVALGASMLAEFYRRLLPGRERP